MRLVRGRWSHLPGASSAPPAALTGRSPAASAFACQMAAVNMSPAEAPFTEVAGSRSDRARPALPARRPPTYWAAAASNLRVRRRLRPCLFVPNLADPVEGSAWMAGGSSSLRLM